MRIHFEGLDLAGKSTVCRLIRDHARGEWQIRHNSLIHDNPAYLLADKLRRENTNSLEPIGWLYHAALLIDLERYKPSKENIIQDSTILLRSLAFHKTNNTPRLAECFEALTDSHPRFDYSFVLVANHKTRMERLRKRRPQNLGPEDFLVRDAPVKFYEMENLLIENATRYFGAIKLDTSGELNVSWLENVFRHIPDLRKD